MEIRLSDLKDKQVTTVSGERLGFISNVILDSTSGELKTLVIMANKNKKGKKITVEVDTINQQRSI